MMNFEIEIAEINKKKNSISLAQIESGCCNFIYMEIPFYGQIVR